MKSIRLLTLLAFCTCATFNGARAADDEDAPKTNVKEVLKARMAEEAKKKPTTPAPKTQATNPVLAPATVAPATAPEKAGQAPTVAVDKTSPAKDAAAKDTVAKDAPAKPNQAATVLPKVEVKKGRITELDQQLAKQEQDIARERKNVKASEVDTALNDAKIAKPMALFGGESSQFRQRVASERVELMEAEKDIMEAIARAKTKEEKQELQKQLDQIKAFRRDLEKSLR